MNSERNCDKEHWSCITILSLLKPKFLKENTHTTKNQQCYLFNLLTKKCCITNSLHFRKTIGIFKTEYLNQVVFKTFEVIM